ncbi:MAG: hypothetical protein JWM65_3750 [Sphingomonas bacterium]|nr:hypothetical protein [Sphingomonas bacterium]
MTVKMPQGGTILEPRHIDVTDADVTDDMAEHMPGACTAVSSILSRVGDKWTVLVVMMLADGPMRFNELKRKIGGVSQRMLTLTLRGLERDGFVSRTMFPTIPPRVDYELTALGQSLRVPVAELGNWAFEHIGVVAKARAEFDMRGDGA